MKKLYTGEVKRMTVKKLDIFPGTMDTLSFESVVVKKDALFYMNFLGVPISIDHGTKLLTKYESQYYLKECAKRIPQKAEKISCIHADGPYTFSHEISDKEFKQLLKTKRAERKAAKKAK